jgi:hypothetical protein
MSQHAVSAPTAPSDIIRDAGRPHDWQSGPLFSALMFIVVRGDRRGMSLSLHAKFPAIAKSLFFTMSRLDFAGEFRRERTRTMVVRKSRRRSKRP